MNIIFKSFQELELIELYDILRLRAEVFVVEQNCVYNDMDELDKNATHVIGYDENQIVAYARILAENTRFVESSIGRIVVSSNKRSLGFGKEIIEASISKIKAQLPYGRIRISAQKHLDKYYTGLGFTTDSDEYLEDGIPHIEMLYI